MIKTEKIFLRKLSPKRDVSKKYLNWMNDPEIQEFTEQRYKRHSLTNIKNFILEKNKSSKDFLFGIFLKKNNNNTHIGNIKIGSINYIHKTAEISYFIGQKEYWGKGYTTIAIKLIIKIAKKMGLKKLKAGVYQTAIGSKKVLKKNNFKLEGIFRSEVVYKGKRCNLYWYGKIL